MLVVIDKRKCSLRRFAQVCTSKPNFGYSAIAPLISGITAAPKDSEGAGDLRELFLEALLAMIKKHKSCDVQDRCKDFGSHHFRLTVEQMEK